MEPLPEVREGLAGLADLIEDPGDLTTQFEAIGKVAVALVPSCVGVSLTVVLDGDPFTLTATSESAAVMDATQYLETVGPCLLAAEDGRVVSVHDVLDEDRWQYLPPAASSLGIRSSLSIPMRNTQGEVVGALNFYAAEADAFAERDQMIATVFGVAGEELVTNADLSFRTRDWARELPERVEARRTVEIAVGTIMQTRGWDSAQARIRLTSAARKAGVSTEILAMALLDLAAADDS